MDKEKAELTTVSAEETQRLLDELRVKDRNLRLYEQKIRMLIAALDQSKKRAAYYLTQSKKKASESAGYRKEYERVMGSGSVKALLRLKRTFGRPYRPKYIGVGEEAEDSFELSKGDEGFFESVADRLRQIPEGCTGKYYRPLTEKIGVICDRFYYDSVFSAADFVYLYPDSWESRIGDIDILLVVSTWKGIDRDEWSGVATEGSRKREILYELMNACKGRGIPVVFYSKEDPPHYHDYLGIAKKSDYIFTTAAEVVDDYMFDCGHDRVWTLGFGINPAFHNPVGIRRFAKQDGVIFSGSWMKKYPERCTDLRYIFDGVLETGLPLKIIDRFYDLHEDERYRYPDAYFRYASPAIEHDDLQKLHKLYNWAININTVKFSSSMFANRVYELQANGNLLLSNYSVGVNSLLPNVFMVHDKANAVDVLRGYTPEEIYERQIAGVRSVMTGETCYDRMYEMLGKIGRKTGAIGRTVLVVAEEITDHVKKQFARQTYRGRVLMSAAEFTAADLSAYDMIAFFAEDAVYEMFYLEDMINAFKYTACDYVTKAARCVDGALTEGPEHDYVACMPDKYCTVFWKDRFSREQLLAMDGPTALENGYSIDHFHFRRGKALAPADAPEKLLFSVIIPVYNNGRQLYTKSFASLQRCSMFRQMEILLVDDGSRDPYTLDMEDYLAERYPNVRVFRFNDGGSGSASRPRNKGVELSSTAYVTFLDTDDEMCNDGYAGLYAQAEKNGNDVTIGGVLRLDRSGALSMNCRGHFYAAPDAPIRTGREYLIESNFMPIRIHSMLLRKDFLTENHLSQVVGGIGEDSLFSYQVVLCAQNIGFVDEDVNIYYAATDGSVVNSIGASFFKKHQRCMDECLRWLQDSDLLENYMESRFSLYIKGWFMEKLSNAKVEEAEECTAILYEILQRFEPYYRRDDETINRFIELCRSGMFDAAYECAFLANIM